MGMLLEFLAVAAALLLVGLTLLPFLRWQVWWVRVWEYPRAQLAAGLAVVGLVLPLVGQGGWLPLTAVVAALLWQAWQISAYTPWHPVQVLPQTGAESCGLRILVANVLQSNREARQLLALVERERPDLLLLLETDRWWDGALRPLWEDFPYRCALPQDNTYGMHLFSRLPLDGARAHYLVQPDIPSIIARVRLRNGRWIRLYCVHPAPPRPCNAVEQQDAELLKVARLAAAEKVPTVVCGDLNDVAWSHTTRLFQRVSGLLDPRIGRGLYSTYHARHWWARWPLDHIFHSASFRLRRLAVLEAFGSDHFPILADLAFDPDAVIPHEIPRASQQDREEAAKRIEKGS